MRGTNTCPKSKTRVRTWQRWKKELRFCKMKWKFWGMSLQRRTVLWSRWSTTSRRRLTCVTRIGQTWIRMNTNSGKNNRSLDRKSMSLTNWIWSSTVYKKRWTTSFMSMSKLVKAEITWVYSSLTGTMNSAFFTKKAISKRTSSRLVSRRLGKKKKRSRWSI